MIPLSLLSIILINRLMEQHHLLEVPPPSKSVISFMDINRMDTPKLTYCCCCYAKFFFQTDYSTFQYFYCSVHKSVLKTLKECSCSFSQSFFGTAKWDCMTFFFFYAETGTRTWTEKKIELNVLFYVKLRSFKKQSYLTPRLIPRRAITI